MADVFVCGPSENRTSIARSHVYKKSLVMPSLSTFRMALAL